MTNEEEDLFCSTCKTRIKRDHPSDDFCSEACQFRWHKTLAREWEDTIWRSFD